MKNSIHVISQKKKKKRLFIQTSIIMLKRNILKNYSHLKNKKNYVGGICIKICVTWLSKQ
jgi:hypothetical protein